MTYEHDIEKRIENISFTGFILLLFVFILQLFGATTFEKFRGIWFLFSILNALMKYIQTGNFFIGEYNAP